MTKGRTERSATRVDTIVGTIAGMIEGGLLKPGERVASVRSAAVDHGVSKNTMAEAYDRLVASGALEARLGSGYFVTAAAARSSRQQPRPDVAEALDLVSLLREQLDQRHAVRPGDGRPPPSWMEGSELGAHFGSMKWPRGGGRSTVEHGYGSSWGFLPLRERIVVSLAERAIKASPEQVLLTLGANQALDLVVRRFVEPGDAVLVDDPGYYPLFGKLKLAKARMVGVRRGIDGPDLDDLHAKLAAAGGARPKALLHPVARAQPDRRLAVAGRGLRPAPGRGAARLPRRRGRSLRRHPPGVQPAARRARPARPGALPRDLLEDALRLPACRLRRRGAGDRRAALRHQDAVRGGDFRLRRAVRLQPDRRRPLPTAPEAPPEPHRAGHRGGAGRPARRSACACRGRAGDSSCGRSCPEVSTRPNSTGKPPRRASSWPRDRCSARSGRRAGRQCGSTSRTRAIRGFSPSWSAC